MHDSCLVCSRRGAKCDVVQQLNWNVTLLDQLDWCRTPLEPIRAQTPTVRVHACSLAMLVRYVKVRVRGARPRKRRARAPKRPLRMHLWRPDVTRCSSPRCCQWCPSKHPPSRLVAVFFQDILFIHCSLYVWATGTIAVSAVGRDVQLQLLHRMSSSNTTRGCRGEDFAQCVRASHCSGKLLIHFKPCSA